MLGLGTAPVPQQTQPKRTCDYRYSRVLFVETLIRRSFVEVIISKSLAKRLDLTILEVFSNLLDFMSLKLLCTIALGKLHWANCLALWWDLLLPWMLHS